ncbi:MAG: pitrilysin family protein [Rikenellaceae bacterium]
MEFYTYILPNGIRGIHRQTKSGVAHCGLLINAGTRDELKGEIGLAHFAEHSIFKGTERRKAYQVNCRLENLGGELNAFTTKEDTTIHATTLRADFSKAVELIADIAFFSTYPEKELEREKEVIFDEINTYKDSPSELIYDTFEELVFNDSELGHNILGLKRDIRRFTGDSIRNFAARCYTTDQMVFSSIGNISPKRVEAIAMRYLGSIPATTRSFERTAPMEMIPFDKTLKRHTHQTHCMIGGRAYGVCEHKRLPLSLLINVLGGPCANSILNTVVRERHGLTYNIEASYIPYVDSGLVSIYFGSERSNTERVIELIDGELSKLCRQPLTPRQLSMAKKQFVAQLAISMESNEGYMLGVGKSYLVHNAVDTTEEVFKKVLSLTSEELMEVANEIFTEKSILIYQ